MDILYIVIPAYNEEANIRQVIREWYPVIEAHPGGGASRMVVIDDGSRDGTFEILKEEAEEHPMLTPVTRTNSGHGATVLYGYRYALEHHADYVFQTDSDGQTRPEEFEPFWKERENCQMVIGWRNARQDGFGRIVTTRVLRLVVTLCFHVRIRDANTPYRLMQAGALEEDLPLIPEDYFLSNVLLRVIFAKKKRKVKEIPITFRPRQGGKNSINMKRIFGIGVKALKEFRILNRRIDEAVRSYR